MSLDGWFSLCYILPCFYFIETIENSINSVALLGEELEFERKRVKLLVIFHYYVCSLCTRSSQCVLFAHSYVRTFFFFDICKVHLSKYYTAATFHVLFSSVSSVGIFKCFDERFQCSGGFRHQ